MDLFDFGVWNLDFLILELVFGFLMFCSWSFDFGFLNFGFWILHFGGLDFGFWSLGFRPPQQKLNPRFVCLHSCGAGLC